MFFPYISYIPTLSPAIEIQSYANDITIWTYYRRAKHYAPSSISAKICFCNGTDPTESIITSTSFLDTPTKILISINKIITLSSYLKIKSTFYLDTCFHNYLNCSQKLTRLRFQVNMQSKLVETIGGKLRSCSVVSAIFAYKISSILSLIVRPQYSRFSSAFLRLNVNWRIYAWGVLFYILSRRNSYKLFKGYSQRFLILSFFF